MQVSAHSTELLKRARKYSARDVWRGLAIENNRKDNHLHIKEF